MSKTLFVGHFQIGHFTRLAGEASQELVRPRQAEGEATLDVRRLTSRGEAGEIRLIRY